jgi:CTP synthase (UTP-ammonia lyase)
MTENHVTRIAILGDFDSKNETHLATDAALEHAAAALGERLDATWIATDELVLRGDSQISAETQVERRLAGFDGVWIAPGSPYRDMQAVITAIRHVRQVGIPTFGTCGGFQHIVLEYGRNVLGLVDASHAEYDPYASVMFVSRLACSLVGKRMAVTLVPDTLARRLYEQDAVDENYYCNFALDPRFEPQLAAAGMTFSGVDEQGNARIVELANHPFYVATLFVPQVNSTAERPHPLIVGFVAAAAERRRGR